MTSVRRTSAALLAAAALVIPAAGAFAADANSRAGEAVVVSVKDRVGDVKFAKNAEQRSIDLREMRIVYRPNANPEASLLVKAFIQPGIFNFDKRALAVTFRADARVYRITLNEDASGAGYLYRVQDGKATRLGFVGNKANSRGEKIATVGVSALGNPSKVSNFRYVSRYTGSRAIDRGAILRTISLT